MKPGDDLYDMHYGGTFNGMKLRNPNKSVTGTAYGILTLTGKNYEMRNCIEWEDDPSDGANSGFGLYIQTVMRQAKRGPYVNKLLTVIGPVLNDMEGWFTAAYAYDGHRCGMCEIREVA